MKKPLPTRLIKYPAIVAIFIASLPALSYGQAKDTVIRSLMCGFGENVIVENFNFNGLKNEPFLSNQLSNWGAELQLQYSLGNPNVFYMSLVEGLGSLYSSYPVGSSMNGYPSINTSISKNSLAIMGFYPLIKPIKPNKVGLYLTGGLTDNLLYVRSVNNNSPEPLDTITVLENTWFNNDIVGSAGLQLDFNIHNGRFGYSSIGLRAGYNFTILKPTGYTWYDCPGGNTKNQVTPSFSFNGFYAGVEFNIWLHRDKQFDEKVKALQYSTPATSDSLSKFKRLMGFYFGLGAQNGNYSGLRNIYVNQPNNVNPIINAEIYFGNPDILFVGMPISAGFSGSSNTTYGNVSSILMNIGGTIGREVYRNDQNKILKAVYPEIGLTYGMASLSYANNGSYTVNSTMLNLALTWDLFQFYGKIRHNLGGTGLASYAITLKTGYNIALTNAKDMNDNIVPNTNLGGFYASLGMNFWGYSSKIPAKMPASISAYFPTPDTSGVERKVFGAGLAGGFGYINFNSLHAYPWLLGQPTNFSPQFYTEFYIGNPEKIAVSIPLAVGNNTINGSYNDSAAAFTSSVNATVIYTGLKALKDITHSDTRKFMKALYGSAGPMFSALGVTAGALRSDNTGAYGNYTYNEWQLLFNAELMADIYDIDFKANGTNIAGLQFVIKCGYNLPLMDARWMPHSAFPFTPAPVSLAEPYLAAGLNIWVNGRKHVK